MRTSRPGRREEGSALLDALAALALIAIALVAAFSSMAGSGTLALQASDRALAAVERLSGRDAAMEAFVARGELP